MLSVVGLAFALVAVIIIGATIRMTVLARSKEISIMRLVGATDSFIRRPFLIEGFAKGILGGSVALAFTPEDTIRLSTIDSLTGLFNRTFFFAAIDREIARSAERSM